MEAFGEAFTAYSQEATKWMQENPDATVADALKWAAENQAGKVNDAEGAQAAAFTAQLQTWANEAKADPEIGGDKFDANIATAMKAIETFGSEDLTNILNESGLGSHPAVIKFAVKAGQALSEGSILGASKPGGGMNLADALYGKNSK